jgi:hypothetical protein
MFKKQKVIPLQAWTGPEGSKRMSLLDFKTMAHEGGKVVSPTHRPPLPSRNIPGAHFCFVRNKFKNALFISFLLSQTEH